MFFKMQKFIGMSFLLLVSCHFAYSTTAVRCCSGLVQKALGNEYIAQCSGTGKAGQLFEQVHHELE